MPSPASVSRHRSCEPDLQPSAGLALFDENAHEPLRGGSWDARVARRTIDDIVHDSLASFDGNGWPRHPRDEHAGGGIYGGSAGVAYALQSLGAPTPVGAEDVIAAAEGDSFIKGRLGAALVAWRLERSTEVAARMEDAARTVIASGENELCWGAAGAAVAATLLFEDTRDERWAAVAGDAVRRLWSTWAFDRDVRACVWTQRRGEETRKFLGAAHGVAGNVHALLRAAVLQSPEHQRELLERTVETLRRTAVEDRGAANWPARTDAPDPRPRVQWCHGAPGIVIALANAPAHRTLDALLLAAGELTWQAGPLVKGHGLCHGTAGNGYAFLKLHRRTRHTKWLERARRFAMHAIAQYEAREAGRYTLFTGDLGLALYLRACVEVDDRFPLLDVL
jgi:Lanthionine synthetase C-like protein